MKTKTVIRRQQDEVKAALAVAIEEYEHEVAYRTYGLAVLRLINPADYPSVKVWREIFTDARVSGFYDEMPPAKALARATAKVQEHHRIPREQRSKA